ncbi:MAG: UDP-N-acetylmuramoyl-tripeptide--D-alanyl-D-alanine ligase [Bacteroides sp.]|nr:UDP-N-acetylmuramoyl-tripeptide--D-alanyl-D-alanine ligase [Eubacterium sp.]MCM1419007.1 UDP-N-acetylmuramoyl-tripeptide--D-alanyl-D-alanine ligase [Roseburia sp.]MCM1462871.1 UDP-N-acetylmuramoyl-tripeptide--D-alanyl-D-alanine ligase [Bacteroides sp.]
MTFLTAAHFIFYAILTFSFAANFLHYMHMFQLNSYDRAEQLLWTGKNLKELFLRHFLPLIAGVYALIFCVILADTGYGCIRYPCPDPGDLLICAGLILGGMVFARPRKAKKKLVFTPRVIRMCVTAGVLYLLVSGLLFLGMDHTMNGGGHLLLLCLGHVLAIFLPMIANFVNKPIERGVNNHYIRDAERIIGELPQTTVIGITGSYGKTSTKFYLEKLLSAKYNVLMTPESYNTTMGVVKTVRGSLNASHEIFLCEMGAKKVGEIKEICDIVHPKHSVITSIGEQHLESFHSVENIVKTKFEIAEGITDGTVFLNYDNAYIREHRIAKNVVTYGIGEGERDYKGTDISVSAKGTAFTVRHNGEEQRFTTRLLGEHNVQNIVGAIAVAHTLGVPFSELVFPVKRLECVPHRMEILDKGNGVTVIDDAFNSNPAGARAALKTLAGFNCDRILVTPGMVELGEREYPLNKELGEYAASCCDLAVLVGERQAPPLREGLLSAGFPEERIRVVKTLEEGLAAAYQDHAGEPRVILLENDLPDNY